MMLPTYTIIVQLLLLLVITNIVLSSLVVSPIMAPFQPGGTVLHIQGTGFQNEPGESSSRTICQLHITGIGVITLANNIVYNSTFMTCTLPSIMNPLHVSNIKSNGNHITLQLLNSIGPLNSTMTQLTLFELDIIEITDINPRWTFITNNATTLYIHGHQFINSSTITCNLAALSNPIEGQFINTSCLICILPAYPFTSRLHVQVYMNGQSVSRLAPLTASVTLFTYYATPPYLLKCQFTPSYAQLLVTFDREIEIGGENDFNTTVTPNCNLIFDSYSVTVLLGNGSYCNWLNTQQRHIVITLPSNTRVQPGVQLTFNSTSIRTRYVTYSRHITGNFTVQGHTITLVPKAILESPQIIPHCGNITLSGVKSQYGGPLSLLYHWNITIPSEGEATSSGELPLNEITLLPDLVPIGYTNQATITLPSSMFTEFNAYYNVTLTVMNFLGHTDSTSTSLIKVSSLSNLAVQIIGSTERTIKINELLKIETIVITPQGCVPPNNTSLLFNWEIYNDTVSTSVHSLTRDIKLNSPTLQIPPNTLSSNMTYHLTLSVSSGSIQPPLNTTLIIRTISPTINNTIQGGSTIVYGSNDNIILNSITPFTTSTVWYCTEANSGCFNELMNTTLVIPSSPQTYLPAQTLSPGQYIFKSDILYNNHSLVSSATQTVVIVSSTDHSYGGPLVYLYSPPQPIHTHRKLVLHGLVSSRLQGRVYWECIHVDGYAYVSLHSIPLSSINITSTLRGLTEVNKLLITSDSNNYTNPISLVIPPSILLPNNKYRFRLTIIDENNRQRYAEINILTSSPPLAGSLVINPSYNGTSLVTTFEYSALQWTDTYGDTPLYYRYGYISNLNTDTVWLTSITEDNYHKTLLPVNTSHVVLEVYDRQGSRTVVTQSVEMTLPGQMIDLMDLYDQLYSLIVKQKQWSQGLSSLIAVLSSINDRHEIGTVIFSEMYIAVFKQLSIELAHNFLSSSPLPTIKASLSRILTIITLCLNDRDNIQLDSDSINLTLNSIEIIINNYIDSDWDPFSSYNGLTPNEATLIMNIYDQLLIRSTDYNTVVLGNRVASNIIYESYRKMAHTIGHGICKSLELYENSVILTSRYFGTLKVYHTIPPWVYNLTCDSNEDRDCPFESSSSVTFGQVIFNEYVKRYCVQSRLLGNFTTCEGTCIVATQSLYDSHWNGNKYGHHIMSNTVKIELYSRERPSSQGLLLPVRTRLILLNDTSDGSTVECVYWNNSTLQWSNNECQTNVISSLIVECTCLMTREVAVINKCLNGYYGQQCSQVCPQGLWGSECSRNCNCNERGTCSPRDGTCNCDPGWTGTACQNNCDSVHWGKDCSEDCLCQNGVCSPYDGSCDCYSGWNDTYCNQSCYGGYYGKDCTSLCTCRSDDECDSVSGECTCQSGYTGNTCNETCPEGYYGIECNATCNCSENGTLHCDAANGTCYCLEQWLGEKCDFEIIYSPSPSFEVPLPEGLPVWFTPVTSVVSLLSLTIIVLFVILVISFIAVKKRKRRQRKVSPISASKEEEGEEEDELQITRSKSLVRLTKSSLQESVGGETSPAGTFQEPDKMGFKLRWQIIQLTSSSHHNTTRSTSANVMRPVKEDPLVEEDINNDLLIEKELAITLEENEESDEFEEVVFLKGVYLEATETLKDLRNKFIDSKQLENGGLYFQFLLSDTPGDVVKIDDEEEITLKRFENQSRTVYIQTINKRDALMELCVCGKFAELVCTECKGKGYCSEQCQENNWSSHVKICRIVSARRREDKKKRKMKRRERRLEKLSRSGFSPNPEICGRCGREAEYECTNCGLQGYCSEECQMKDWKYHRLYCEEQHTLTS